MLELFAVLLSALALLLSGIALYVVNFWKGKIRCSKPKQFFFGYANEDKTTANVSVQCFMHSTGIVGQVIDHMFLEVEQGETKQAFTSWSAGTNPNNRARLAGFKVPRDGHSIDFIFFTPPQSKNFRFSKGNLTARLKVRLSGSKKYETLFEEKFKLEENLYTAIDTLNLAVFELGSTGESYHSYADTYKTSLPNNKEIEIKNKK